MMEGVVGEEKINNFAFRSTIFDIKMYICGR